MDSDMKREDGAEGDKQPSGVGAITFTPLRSIDLVTQISRLITEAIVTGRLKPGDRLTELQLSKEFGTSRAPVREAARLLENQGLVVSSPRRGFFVRTLTADEMREIYDLRICLEMHAAGIAMNRISDEEIDALARQVARLHASADDGSIEKQIFEDFAFHRMLCKAGGNARLLKVYDELAAEMSVGITLIGKLYDNPHLIAESHDPLLKAIEGRNKPELLDALHYHISIAKTEVVALFDGLETNR
jgi:DNA-binding GntR family transcriptional regulator